MSLIGANIIIQNILRSNLAIADPEQHNAILKNEYLNQLIEDISEHPFTLLVEIILGIFKRRTAVLTIDKNLFKIDDTIVNGMSFSIPASKLRYGRDATCYITRNDVLQVKYNDKSCDYSLPPPKSVYSQILGSYISGDVVTNADVFKTIIVNICAKAQVSRGAGHK